MRLLTARAWRSLPETEWLTVKTDNTKKNGLSALHYAEAATECDLLFSRICVDCEHLFGSVSWFYSSIWSRVLSEVAMQ